MSKAEERPNKNNYFDGTNFIDTEIGIIKYSKAQDEYIDYLKSYADEQNKMPSDEEIEKTIRETLVIINKESVKYAIDKIKKLYKN